ncbi:MAG: superoxide dismutase [Bacilli bacterium]|nr:superoxide dismutase [Bacilli bacterium]
MVYELPKLPYAYDALEPVIDARTVEIHYSKHHQTYLNNLNKIVEENPDVFNGKSIEEVLSNLDLIPTSIRQQVINQGGGYYNHNLYWANLSPNGGGEPQGKLREAIDKTFGSFDSMKEKLAQAAKGVFGSGYGQLVLDNQTKELEIIQTKNQDAACSIGKTTLLIIDVWEHAYYLAYQNRRPDYVDKIFSIVNWDEVEKRYDLALSK